MKKILLSACFLLTVCLLQAQTSFGVISYTLPEGWTARQSGEDLEFVKKGEENSGCKITLFKQMNSLVTTEKQFRDLWASKTNSGSTAVQKAGIPVRKEEDGWVSISGSKTTMNGASTDTEGFHTLCDGSLTAAILTQSKGSACTKEINSILASINIPVKDSNPKLRAKSKKTKFPYVYR